MRVFVKLNCLISCIIATEKKGLVLAENWEKAQSSNLYNLRHVTFSAIDAHFGVN